MSSSARFCTAFLLFCLFSSPVMAMEPQLSAETEDCLSCHEILHPGLVSSWKKSRHSRTTPAGALRKPESERRISAQSVAESRQNVIVGCYECHSLRSAEHGDAFDHNGYVVNVVVSPADCATCHPVEADQYSHNIMAHAYGNLMDNSLYRDLIQVVNNHYDYSGGKLKIGEDNPLSDQESCLYCHGTRVEVDGMETRDTDFGELMFPKLTGWPNQGVGRINPDSSKGACSACHTRHAFAIETARKPHTCSECHKGPDVPAYKVYKVSKHGNIYESHAAEFDFSPVPWVVGRDFTAPTCAACHAAEIATADGEVIAKRTHTFNDRLSWRIFGVPYAHPHPVDADLSDVVNSDGLPLAVELTGEPVAEFVLSKEQQQENSERMQAVCSACHSGQWIDGHFARLDNTIKTTNKRTRQATEILAEIWQEDFERGLPQGDNIFDEKAERMWTTIWLFYANSTRFASAMAGGGDYGVFAKGRYQTTDQLNDLWQQLELYRALKE